ncbi:MAG: pyridoxal phosphate-dependent aminotransferase [Candidatus Aminicenantes bacterium]|nr:pyridoxal phosphate-dependent aminotransferase [Candidatus Aminicenantes bacterium]
MISEKAIQIGTSPTLKISAKAKAMKAAGLDVIDLSVGEPDFPTPDNVKQAGIRAIQENFTKYTENEGIPALKKAIIKRMKDDYGLHYEPNEVIVSCGAKASLFHLIMALINEGEEVIIPAPYWVTYPQAVLLAKGKPVIVSTKEENGFVLTPEELKAVITPSTKALILNNPSNPTGAAYNRKQLEALAEIIRHEDIYVIADEIYGKLVYEDFEFVSFASLGEEIKKKTIIVNGVSKTYSMTGWRIGFTLGPAEIINAMAKIQSHTTSNPTSISQMASLEALRGPQYEVQRMVAEFQRRRNYCLMKLRTIPHVSCFKPQGAFYLFPNFSYYYDKEAEGMQIRNSYGLAYYLLKEARVAVVPGDSFGADNYIRISYATSMENLEKGMDRIIAAIAKLKPSPKARRVILSNVQTKVKKAPPIEAEIDLKRREALQIEVESHLSREKVYIWNANINGVIIQLRTNVSHLNDFWIENWFPAQLEAEIEPHGVIYAVDGLAGRESRAFYNPETRTAFLINTDLYGPLRSLALGMVIEITQSQLTTNALRGLSVDYKGNGLVLVGPPGTRKTELFFELLSDSRFRLQANDLIFIRLSGKTSVAECVERKLYLTTPAVELYPALAPLFDLSKCENVVTKKEDCQDADCQRDEDCRLDRGAPFCYRASANGYAMLDPNWLYGQGGYPRRNTLRWIFILRSDAVSPDFIELTKEEALRVFESGETPGAQRTIASGKHQPFFNPHLLGLSPDKLELQRSFFQRLFDSVTVYLFNSGLAGADKIKRLIAAD